MFAKQFRLLHVAVFIAGVIGLLYGCGGGGASGDSAAAVGDASPGGYWKGTIEESRGTDPSGKPYPTKILSIEGIVAEDGSYAFVNGQWKLFVGTAVVQGAELSSDGRWVSGWVEHRSGSGYGEGYGGASFISGIVDGRRRITGNIVSEGGTGSGVSGSVSLEFKKLYLLHSSLETIAGTYVGAYAPDGFVLTIDDLGRVFGQRAYDNCVVTGMVTLIDPGYNAYHIDISPSNCSRGSNFMNGLEFSGLAYVNPSKGRSGGIRYLTVAPFLDGYVHWTEDLERQ